MRFLGSRLAAIALAAATFGGMSALMPSAAEAATSNRLVPCEGGYLGYVGSIYGISIFHEANAYLAEECFSDHTISIWLYRDSKWSFVNLTGSGATLGAISGAFAGATLAGYPIARTVHISPYLQWTSETALSVTSASGWILVDPCGNQCGYM